MSQINPNPVDEAVTMSTLVFLLVGLGMGSPSLERHAAAEIVAAGGIHSRAAETALVERGRKGLWALAGAFRRIRDPESRGRLLAAVGRFNGVHTRAAFWLLRKGLMSSVPEIRRGAVRGLDRLDHPRTGHLLMRHLDDPDPEVRQALAEVLHKLGEHVEVRMTAKQDDASPAVREVALRFLARRLSGEPQRGLLARALLDPASRVRTTAIELAAVLRDPAHIEALSTLARRGAGDEAVLATKALLQLPGGRYRLHQLIEDAQAPLPAVKEALQYLRSSRRHALDLLVPSLLALPERRRAVLETTLVTSASDEEIRDLVYLLDHPEPTRRRLAERWLSMIGDRGDEIAAEVLIEARQARRDVLRDYLVTRPGGGVSPAMLERARRGGLSERVAMIRAIGAIASPTVRHRLVDLLGDAVPEVRAAAASAVADLETAEAGLLVLAVDPVVSVRVAAVAALEGQLGDLSWDARLAALRDEAEEVRIAAIRSFTGTRHPDALKRLENRVLLGTPRERVAAVEAIAESPTTRAAVKLVELVAHRDPVIRHAALSYVDAL